MHRAEIFLYRKVFYALYMQYWMHTGVPFLIFRFSICIIVSFG
uniref:Uncharacterized protein n=1 Tax=Anguilla anguilla TaxID=7936 RepID=A0A0E9QI20_ANGAN